MFFRVRVRVRVSEQAGIVFLRFFFGLRRVIIFLGLFFWCFLGLGLGLGLVNRQG